MSTICHKCGKPIEARDLVEEDNPDDPFEPFYYYVDNNQRSSIRNNLMLRQHLSYLQNAAADSHAPSASYVRQSNYTLVFWITFLIVCR